MSAPEVQPAGQDVDLFDYDGYCLGCGNHREYPHEPACAIAAHLGVVEGLRTQLAKAQADHVAWCEANYTIGRENMRPTLEEFRSRALAAEGQVAAVKALAEEWAKLAPEDDWGESPGDTQQADIGRYLLRVLSSESRLG